MDKEIKNIKELKKAIGVSCLKTSIRKQLLESLHELEALKNRYTLLEDEIKRMKQNEQRTFDKEFNASVLQEAVNAKLRVIKSVTDALLDDRVNMNDLYAQITARK